MPRPVTRVIFGRVKAYVAGGLQHVVSVPPRDGHKGDSGGVVTNLLDVGGDLLGDLIVTLLAVGGLGGVHLVDADDELLHSQGVSQESVLTSLAVLGDTSLKLTHTTSNDEHSTVGLEGG